MIHFVDFNELFLEKSWGWLNDPEIKKLTNTPHFSKEEQLKWFKELPYLDNYKIWGVVIGKIPVGVFGIKNIKKNSGEYFGYIGNKEYWGMGIGYEALKIIIQKAEKEFSLQSLYLFVIKSNIRAINLYKKSGFEIEKSGNKNQIKMVLNL